MRRRKTALFAFAVLMVGTGAAFTARSEQVEKRLAGIQTGTVTLPTQMGQWWLHRGDYRLSGRTTLKGDITRPTIQWQHSLTGRETILHVQFAEGKTEITLPPKDIELLGVDWNRYLADWGIGTPYRDVVGDGVLRPIPQGNNLQVGKILEGKPGLQIAQMDIKEFPHSTKRTGTARIKVIKDGQWVDHWTTDIDTLGAGGQTIYGDFDRDGKKEIACISWYRMHVFDAETGRHKEAVNFVQEGENYPAAGRAYGYFGAHNLDDDGRDEFVIICDFARHIGVLGWRNGELHRLWIKKLIPQVPRGEDWKREHTRMLRVNPEPVHDIDGDGKKEILLSIYNPAGDHRWHVWAIDGMTGEVDLDIPQQYLNGVRDANGDGIAELFCTACPNEGLHIPNPANLSLLSYKSKKLTTLWKLDGAAFEEHDIPQFPANENSGASTAKRTILCAPVAPGCRSVFFTRRLANRQDETAEVTAWQVGDDKAFHQLGTMSAPRLVVIATRSDEGDGCQSVLVRAQTSDGDTLHVTGRRARFEAIRSRQLAPPITPPVVGKLTPGAPPTVIVQAANETMVALRTDGAGGMRQAWRVRGRGMHFARDEGPIIADISGDGNLTTFVATRTETDGARLTGLDANGAMIWKADFDWYPGDPPPWNHAGLIYWQAGYFTAHDHMDILVQLRIIGSDTRLLDGKNARQIWQRDSIDYDDEGFVRTFGRQLMPVFDYDGDGLEDILNTWEDFFCVVKGSTGEQLRVERSGKLIPGAQGFTYSSVAYLLSNGNLQVVYSGQNVISLTRLDGTAIWWSDAIREITEVQAGYGDLDGDGKMDIIIPALPNKDINELEFHCWDAATGSKKWKLSLDKSTRPTDPCVADIDGDGRDECIVAVGRILYAISGTPDGRSGIVKWKLEMPGTLGIPAIADVDGGGKAQIVIVCGDGMIYGIGQGDQ